MNKVLILAAVMVGGCIGCASVRVSDCAEAVIPTEPPSPGGIPTPQELVEHMNRSLEATPVLHVTIHNRHHGEDYDCQGWMTETKVLGVVRKGGKLVYASFSDGQRNQEFVKNSTFANGQTGENVLVEYDLLPDDGGWPRLLEPGLACGPGTVAVCWRLGERPSLAEILLLNREPATLVETTLDGRTCYYMKLVNDVGQGRTLTWELYVDKATAKPIRQSRITKSSNKVYQDSVYDYTFEHLPDDSGIHWGLDVERLRKE